MSVPWTNLIPSFPTFGTPGHNLGYYYKIADLLFITPLVLLIVIAIPYNVLLGFATKWMYTNAWQKKLPAQKVQEQPDSDEALPTTNTWEEIFVVNTKIANYLLGNNAVVIKEQNGYLVLQIHDYIISMPFAIVFIQVSQLAVAMFIVVLFVDYLVLQVTHTCDSSHTGVDCFLSTETDRDAPPIDCANPDLNVTANITCFHLSFNPVIASAIAGGFLKFGPHILYSVLTFQYFKYLNKIKQKLHFSTTKGNMVVHIVVAIILEVCFIGVGLMALFIVLFVPSIRDITYSTANPMKQLTVIFGFIMYFMMAGFLWCIVPQTSTPVRFLTAVWKGHPFVAMKTPVNGGGEKLRPWVVVDPSLSTSEHQHLLKD